jgi:hypothetical protein
MSTASPQERDTVDELEPGHAERFDDVRSDHASDQLADERQIDADDESAAGDYSQYRALSPAAVTSCVLGLASGAAFFDWWLVVLPVLGLALGVFALRRIAAREDELTGRHVAMGGVVLSGLCLIGSQGRHWYERLTEVPDGHIRISYADLQPPERSVVPISDAARDFDGQRVFIKGYVLAGNRTKGIRTFILVRDQGDCCFGGNPKLTDRILVQLKDGETFNYTDRLQKLAGRFQVKPGQAVDVAGDVVYQLDDAEIL